jgi:hypothetical protein
MVAEELQLLFLVITVLSSITDVKKWTLLCMQFYVTKIIDNISPGRVIYLISMQKLIII